MDGCAGSSTLTVACWIAGCCLKYAPTSLLYQAQLYPLSAAAWTPTKPPPFSMYRWKASFWSWVETGSPVVDMKITAWYCARFASVNWALSSVVSTAKLFSWPSFCTAAMPSGIESCRKPVVFEKTRTLKSGAAAAVVAAWALTGAEKSVMTGATRAKAIVAAVRRFVRRPFSGRAALCGLAHVR